MAVVLAAFAAATGLAHAAGIKSWHADGVLYESKAFKATPQVETTGKVFCQKGHVASGGVTTIGNPAKMRVGGLGPATKGLNDTIPDDGYEAVIDGRSASRNRFTVFAICSTGAFVYEDQLDGPYPNPVYTEHGHGCAGGLDAVGGGVMRSEGFGLASVIGSLPDQLEVWLSALQTGQPVSGVLTQAICKDGWDLALRTKTVNLDLGDHGTGLARCRPHETLVGGGAAGSDFEMYLEQSRPVDTGDSDRAPDDAWRGSLTDNYQDGEQLTIAAVCRKPG